MSSKKDFPALNDLEREIMERYALEEIDDVSVIDLLNELYENYLVAHSKSVRVLLLQKLLNVAGIYQLIPFKRFIENQAELHVLEVHNSGLDKALPFEVIPFELLKRAPFRYFIECSVSEGVTLNEMFQRAWDRQSIKRILFFSELKLVPDASRDSTSFSEALTGTICIRISDLPKGFSRDFFSLLIDLAKQARYLQLVYESTDRLVPTHVRAAMNEAAIRFLIDALVVLDMFTEGSAPIPPELDPLITEEYVDFLIDDLFKECVSQYCSYIGAGNTPGREKISEIILKSCNRKISERLIRILD